MGQINIIYCRVIRSALVLHFLPYGSLMLGLLCQSVENVPSFESQGMNYLNILPIHFINPYLFQSSQSIQFPLFKPPS